VSPDNSCLLGSQCATWGPAGHRACGPCAPSPSYYVLLLRNVYPADLSTWTGCATEHHSHVVKSRNSVVLDRGWHRTAVCGSRGGISHPRGRTGVGMTEPYCNTEVHEEDSWTLRRRCVSGRPKELGRGKTIGVELTLGRLGTARS
jgi:hypothetical protein